MWTSDPPCYRTPPKFLFTYFFSLATCTFFRNDAEKFQFKIYFKILHERAILMPMVGIIALTSSRDCDRVIVTVTVIAADYYLIEGSVINTSRTYALKY